MPRRAYDFYETAPWQTETLLRHQPICGVVLEPCIGDQSITRVIEAQCDVAGLSNDIDPARAADYHLDAASPKLYQRIEEDWGGVDWVVTNPPYAMPTCLEIVQQAVRHARVGVAMMLRISFREPTHARGPWLRDHPPSRLLTLPRYSFTGNGKSDSATTEWVIWLKHMNPAVNILSCYGADHLFATTAAPSPLQLAGTG